MSELSQIIVRAAAEIEVAAAQARAADAVAVEVDPAEVARILATIPEKARASALRPVYRHRFELARWDPWDPAARALYAAVAEALGSAGLHAGIEVANDHAARPCAIWLDRSDIANEALRIRTAEWLAALTAAWAARAGEKAKTLSGATWVTLTRSTNERGHTVQIDGLPPVAEVVTAAAAALKLPRWSVGDLLTACEAYPGLTVSMRGPEWDGRLTVGRESLDFRSAHSDRRWAIAIEDAWQATAAELAERAARELDVAPARAAEAEPAEPARTMLSSPPRTQQHQKGGRR